jgi:hypothetical protein
MTFRHLFTLLGIVLALTFVPAALAADLLIDDSVEAQITLAHDANWEFGVLSNGVLFPARAPGSTTAPGEVATFSGSWSVNSRGNPDPGTGVIYFVDQAANRHSCQRGDRRGHRHHGHHGHRRHSLDQARHQADVRRGGKHRRNGCVSVSDIITANWSTVAGSPFGRATITFTIVSSACGRNLGSLPPQFSGLGVPDPTTPIQIGGLFRNPVTAAPVAIPSNLTVKFVGDRDTPCKSDDDDDEDDD